MLYGYAERQGCMRSTVSELSLCTVSCVNFRLSLLHNVQAQLKAANERIRAVCIGVLFLILFAGLSMPFFRLLSIEIGRGMMRNKHAPLSECLKSKLRL